MQGKDQKNKKKQVKKEELSPLEQVLFLQQRESALKKILMEEKGQKTMSVQEFLGIK